jgi:iron(III) transport system substrate-binding protein
MAAKKEGRLNVYIDYSASSLIDSGAFQKEFPEIKVFSVPNRNSLVRISAERRAGKYIPDVNIAGITHNYPDLYNAKALDPIKSAFILLEVIDESAWWQGRHRYADPEGRYVFIYLGFPQEGSLSYNTKLVNPKEFRSLWDFVNPKWKGKIAVRDTQARGPGGGALRFFYAHRELGPEFIRRLYGTMDALVFRDQRLAMDWLATGRVAICMGCGNTEREKAQGLPVDEFGPMKEGAGLVAQYGTIALMNQAPHPNAAKIFVNWFLSREGQLALQKALAKAPESAAPDSFRTDIPKDDVARANRRLEGVKYLEMFTPERMDMRPVIKVASEAIAQAGKR